jgi:hypothetical protein
MSVSITRFRDGKRELPPDRYQIFFMNLRRNAVARSRAFLAARR